MAEGGKPATPGTLSQVVEARRGRLRAWRAARAAGDGIELETSVVMDRMREDLRLPPSAQQSSARTPTEVALPRVLPQPAQIAVRKEYRLDELLVYNGATFVRNAYRAILQRDADEPGFAWNLGL